MALNMHDLHQSSLRAKVDMSIDSYRFLDFASRQVMKAWAARQKPGIIPFTPLMKPLGECTVARRWSTRGVAIHAATSGNRARPGHLHRAAVCVARVAGSGAKCVQRSAAATDRGTSDQEAVAAGESL